MILKFRRNQPAVTPRIPPGLRVYAIGDIHGRADLLEAAAGKIARDSRDAPRTLTIFLGDYIDRGRDSAAVLERLSKRDFPTDFVALRGNHEQTMLDALDDPRIFEFWRRYGAVETLASYGVDVADVMRGAGFVEARDELRRKAPPEHIAFLKALPLSHEIGDYFFCHAGVKPGRPLSAQEPRDLMFIRREFLDSAEWRSKVIVHGHTPVEAPEFRANRINLDTGAYATNRLTCLALEEDRQWILE
ncbi:serine/threonine protein phosphatase [Rhodoblastus acidophilus]|uniref:Serine/threonine protein phosphatase n=1 Tax=Candidatus Rhodoblastus alkanivorans TaxID=2954117 RepID=A0ABS9Z7P8_9HYPH|nr:metallophosphoesterase family protein [Candidatus Rhodoblastus alkanivorans]MCI4678738.1 serine/threonine protein phosphatase [Candidatus Rhodoblastus alkanivorans]MCI4683466.1 serine/threonine protein phosphatase [Candidatus Rhodoblastus alkanivorans]MDI4640780.1 serine/threonine protein phosphatase [Rhodoblastus acidophilus]